MARDAYRLASSCLDRQTTRHCRLIQAVSRCGIPYVPLSDVVVYLQQRSGTIVDSVIVHPRLRGFRSGSVAEMAALSVLTAAKRPRSILEFGTCDGISAWHLWANSSPETTIVTLDHPLKTMAEDSTDRRLGGTKERVFLPASSRITLIETDSRDWKPNISAVDLCFIDAGHMYDCVRNDTEKAFGVMNSDGLIVWHDAAWPKFGVNRYLRELRTQGLDIRILRVGPYDYCALAVLLIGGRRNRE